MSSRQAWLRTGTVKGKGRISEGKGRTNKVKDNNGQGQQEQDANSSR